MKSVKNFVFLVLLLSGLAFNTFAGDIQTPGITQPPPQRLSVSDDEPSTPVSGTDTQQTEGETSDYLLYEALAALLSVY